MTIKHIYEMNMGERVTFQHATPFLVKMLPLPKSRDIASHRRKGRPLVCTSLIHIRRQNHKKPLRLSREIVLRLTS
jgi:hypothetical protein